MKKNQIGFAGQLFGKLVTAWLLLTNVAPYDVKAMTAAPWSFRHFQVEDGVANNWIISIEQDYLGFMWFGTLEGLSRFDGRSFKTFHPNQISPELSKTCFILSLFQDKHKTLWVGTTVGLFKYHFASENFELVAQTRNRTVSQLSAGPEYGLCFLMDGAFYGCEGKTCKVIYNKTPLTSFLPALGSGFWLGTADGRIIRLKQSKSQYVTAGITHLPELAGPVLSIKDVGRSHLLIGTSAAGLFRLDLHNGSMRRMLHKNKNGTNILDIRKIIAVNSDEYWISSESGIYIYQASSDQFQNLRKNYRDPYSLSDDAVHSLFADNTGSVWVGTYSGGINYFGNARFGFKKYYVNGRSDGLSGNYINRICEDDHGQIWIGTGDNGLNKLDPSSGIITQLRERGNGGPLVYHNVQGLVVDGNRVWVGTYFHGLKLYDLHGNPQKNRVELSALNNKFIVSMCRTRSGDVLIGTSDAVYRYEPVFKSLTRQAGIPSQIPICFSIVEDLAGTIWIGTKGAGLHYYNAKTKKSGNFVFNPKDSTSLASNYINDLLVDSLGNLWVATDGGGLCLLDRKGSFTRFTIKNGLVSDHIQKILEESKGTIWISTTKGLMRCGNKMSTLEIFTSKNGLPSDQFIAASGYRARNGEMYFGTARGMVSFQPGDLSGKTEKAKIFLTDISVENQPVEVSAGGRNGLSKSIILSDSLTLSYDKSTFEVSFSSLDYQATQELAYDYKMEGLINKWTALNGNSKLYFTSVPAGNYTLRIRHRARAAEGSSAVLAVVVTPPFWATPWAKALYVLTGFALIALTTRHFYLRQIQKVRQQQENELFEEKLDFLGNIAHEINTPLTLIKGPLEIVKEHLAGSEVSIQKQLTTLERNTNRLIKLTGELLDFRKSQTKSYHLNLTKVDFSELVLGLATLFEDFADKQGIRFRIELNEQPCFVNADPEALNKIVTNLLSNAFKYCENDVQIMMNCDSTNQSVVLIVRNDGPIVPPEARENIFKPFVRLRQHARIGGSGLGLAITRTLSDLHGGKLIYQTENNLNVFALTLGAIR